MITIVEVKDAIIARLASQIAPDMVPVDRMCFDILEQGIEYPALFLHFARTDSYSDLSGGSVGLGSGILLIDCLHAINSQAEYLRKAVINALRGYVSPLIDAGGGNMVRVLQGFTVEESPGAQWDEDRNVWRCELTMFGHFAEAS